MKQQDIKSRAIWQQHMSRTMKQPNQEPRNEATKHPYLAGNANARHQQYCNGREGRGEGPLGARTC